MTQQTLANPGSRPRPQRGFSMAEVLVAVALLSVIILALFGLVTAGVQRAYSGRKMTEGTVLAQAVLERANVEGPQDLVNVSNSTCTAAASTSTCTWTMTSGVVTPAAESGSTVPITERNAWRNLLATSGLPSRAGAAARLAVTMTALPDTGTPRTFANAAAVRIQVDVTWTEFEGRTRQVRLQTLNVRSANL